MKAIILAAGRGNRMKMLTGNQPKCFTELHGKRLIDWQLEALHSAGISQIAIVRGYSGDSFKFDVTYFDNPRWAQTNMVQSLLCAAEWLREFECIVSYSDIVYGPKTVQRLVECPAEISITYDPNWFKLWSMRFKEPLSDAETFQLDEADQIVEIGNRAKNVDEIQGQYMGLLKFSPQGWRSTENFLEKLSQAEIDRLDMTKLLQSLASNGINIRAVPVNDGWLEVDSEYDLGIYNKLLSDRKGIIWWR